MTTESPTNPMATPSAEIEARLRAALDPVVSLHLRDDSAHHAGHAGAREGGHYYLEIVSSRFAGLPRVARHRLVYDALADLMKKGIHALAIDARAPDEQQKQVQ
ncbi:BolA family protein [Roseateles amylovorans]|uniref:BolA family transcriptional regulator n=1 Tax=Roseateles amylovorans TaxID=2978473 RepID=A0ABY6AZ90_9BURK|nr:BolA family protein [Roseateles amylovorans]UXH77211.1 BolA family transcriptional regulator [Roseateles amylovorans]